MYVCVLCFAVVIITTIIIISQRKTDRVWKKNPDEEQKNRRITEEVKTNSLNQRTCGGRTTYACLHTMLRENGFLAVVESCSCGRRKGMVTPPLSGVSERGTRNTNNTVLSFHCRKARY